ncbi:hypothetical protein HDR67_01520 [bacterium]|nr:hypothetical protein [bacterium]
MKRKRVFVFLAIGLLSVVLLGSSLSTGSTEVSGDIYDTAYYVDGSKNLFIMTAKFIDKCCFYVVDAVVSGVGSVFGTILNN